MKTEGTNLLLLTLLVSWVHLYICRAHFSNTQTFYVSVKAVRYGPQSCSVALIILYFTDLSEALQLGRL